MKKIIWSVMAVLLLAACQESLEDRCAREAREYTEKHCPTPVGKDVIMDSMTFDKATHTISYAYSLRGPIDDSAYVNGSNTRQLLQEQVKNSAHLRLYKEAGYSFRYVYYSTKNKGTKLFEASFHQKDYE